LRFYHILVKMAIFKKINKIMCSKGAGEWTLIHCWSEYKLVQALWKSV
jgi:hypothetical protein